MHYLTKNEVISSKKIAEALCSELTSFPAQWSADLQVENKRSAEKQLSKWCRALISGERMQVAALGVFVHGHISPHLHIFVLGFSAQTGRTLKDLDDLEKVRYERLWPADAKITAITDQTGKAQYITQPKNTPINGFDLISYNEKLIRKFKNGRRLPDNVRRRQNGLSVVDIAQTNPSFQGQLKRRLKRIQQHEGATISTIIENINIQNRLGIKATTNIFN